MNWYCWIWLLKNETSFGNEKIQIKVANYMLWWPVKTSCIICRWIELITYFLYFYKIWYPYVQFILMERENKKVRATKGTERVLPVLTLLFVKPRTIVSRGRCNTKAARDHGHRWLHWRCSTAADVECKLVDFPSCQLQPQKNAYMNSSHLQATSNITKVTHWKHQFFQSDNISN